MLQWQLQIGSLLFPESPCTSVPETFSLLRSAVGILDESIRTVNITNQSYLTNGFLIGCPLQSVPNGSFSGLNTRSGDLLTVKIKNLSQDNTTNGAGRIFICLVNESLIEIREGSVSILD